MNKRVLLKKKCWHLLVLLFSDKKFELVKNNQILILVLKSKISSNLQTILQILPIGNVNFLFSVEQVSKSIDSFFGG